MPQTNLLDELLTRGIEERLTHERRSFIKDLESKIENLVESGLDSKALVKNLLDYLNEIKQRLTLRNY